MHSAAVFFQEMLVLYGMAALGFMVRKKGILNEHTNDVLTRLILYITLPALILYSLDISFSISLLSDFLWLVLMSIVVLILSCMMASWMGKHSSLQEKQKSVYKGIIIFGNQGFIGYAVSFILYGEQGILYLTIFNICYLILIWTYGIFLFSHSKDSIPGKSIFLNPGILSTFIGLMILILPLSWPAPISNGLESIGKMTIPLSMMMIGSLVANVKYSEFPLLIRNVYLWYAALAKLLIIPLLLVPFLALEVPFHLLLIAVLVSGMPSAPTISLYAQRHGADSFFASLGVLLTTLLCILTLPLLYSFLNFLNSLY